MAIEQQHFKTIDRYLERDEGLPLIVDVQNDEDFTELVQHYNVGKAKVVHASDYCAKDELPQLDKLLHDLAVWNSVTIVVDVTWFLKLQGEDALSNFLLTLLNLNISGHVIFVTYQCSRYLKMRDPRLGRRILIVKGYETGIPEVVFTEPSLLLPEESTKIRGIERFAGIAEEQESQAVYMITKKQCEFFPHSLYKLSNLRDAYEAILLKDGLTSVLPREIGTAMQWQYALKLFAKENSWEAVIDNIFGDHKHLDQAFVNYMYYDTNEQWLFFVALKLFGAKTNWCLTTAASNAEAVTDFVNQIYRCLLEKSVQDKDFWDCYKIRKVALQQLGNPTNETSTFCKVVFSKGVDAIYYLTDNTIKEKETIFAYLDRYGQQVDQKKLMQILEKVYPALHSYLLPYRFDNELLNKYFQDYKYQKVINKVLPEFEVLVKEQASKRDYNLILQPRSSLIEGLKWETAKLYFIDAMGVEYLSYILAVCNKLNIIANITVCRAELPTITSKNKEFVRFFEEKGCPVVSDKELDEIKHQGKNDYDFYKNSKLPIHLISELAEIEKVLKRIKEDLSDRKFTHVFMISDHGASRLAVLHDTENIWEMSEKGKHSGRCCPKGDVDIQPEFATDADDFWALANYDRFKGGRKANVEVHGGATLEELCVPIIELTYLAEKPEIKLMPLDGNAYEGNVPVIEVSFRKTAGLKVFISAMLPDLKLCVNDNYYGCEQSEPNTFKAIMPDLKKAGTYYADIYAGNNLLVEKLPFIIKKEGQREKALL